MGRVITYVLLNVFLISWMPTPGTLGETPSQNYSKEPNSTTTCEPQFGNDSLSVDTLEKLTKTISGVAEELVDLQRSIPTMNEIKENSGNNAITNQGLEKLIKGLIKFGVDLDAVERKVTEINNSARDTHSTMGFRGLYWSKPFFAEAKQNLLTMKEAITRIKQRYMDHSGHIAIPDDLMTFFDKATGFMIYLKHCVAEVLQIRKHNSGSHTPSLSFLEELEKTLDRVRGDLYVLKRVAIEIHNRHEKNSGNNAIAFEGLEKLTKGLNKFGDDLNALDRNVTKIAKDNSKNSGIMAIFALHYCNQYFDEARQGLLVMKHDISEMKKINSDHSGHDATLDKVMDFLVKESVFMAFLKHWTMDLVGEKRLKPGFSTLSLPVLEELKQTLDRVKGELYVLMKCVSGIKNRYGENSGNNAIAFEGLEKLTKDLNKFGDDFDAVEKGVTEIVKNNKKNTCGTALTHLQNSTHYFEEARQDLYVLNRNITEIKKKNMPYSGQKATLEELKSFFHKGHGFMVFLNKSVAELQKIQKENAGSPTSGVVTMTPGLPNGTHSTPQPDIINATPIEETVTDVVTPPTTATDCNPQIDIRSGFHSLSCENTAVTSEQGDNRPLTSTNTSTTPTDIPSSYPTIGVVTMTPGLPNGTHSTPQPDIINVTQTEETDTDVVSPPTTTTHCNPKIDIRSGFSSLSCEDTMVDSDRGDTRPLTTSVPPPDIPSSTELSTFDDLLKHVEDDLAELMMNVTEIKKSGSGALTAETLEEFSKNLNKLEGDMDSLERGVADIVKSSKGISGSGLSTLQTLEDLLGYSKTVKSDLNTMKNGIASLQKFNNPDNSAATLGKFSRFLETVGNFMRSLRNYVKNLVEIKKENSERDLTPGGEISVSKQKKKYALSSTSKASWNGADQHCRSFGMQLASIESEEEELQLELMIKSIGIYLGPLWTSGLYQGSEERFVWNSTGKPITYNKWGDGEPRESREGKCLQIDINKLNAIWVQEACDSPRYFVCEYLGNKPQNVKTDCVQFV